LFATKLPLWYQVASGHTFFAYSPLLPTASKNVPLSALNSVATSLSPQSLYVVLFAAIVSVLPLFVTE
jgi:hypothetical protein